MVLLLRPVAIFKDGPYQALLTAKSQVREVENEPIFKGCSRAVPFCTGEMIQRQPLRPLASTVHNVAVNVARPGPKQNDKLKAFAVYSDRSQMSNVAARMNRTDTAKRSSPIKRPSDHFTSSASRPAKRRSPDRPPVRPTMSKQTIEDIIERKVTDILAARAIDQPSIRSQLENTAGVQRRLEMLEQKIDGQDDGREQGLTFLLCAKQHAVRGEDGSALKMYSLAKGFFPSNKKLDHKIEKLREKIQLKKQEDERRKELVEPSTSTPARNRSDDDHYKEDPEAVDDTDYGSDGGFHYKAKSKKSAKASLTRTPPDDSASEALQSPGTRRLLEVINTRDVAQIRLLRGVGAKRAEGIIEALCSVEDEEGKTVRNVDQLGRLKGVGNKTVANMRAGLQPMVVDEH